MRTILLLLVSTVLFSCGRKKSPQVSSAILQSVIKKYPNAERIDTSTLNSWRESFKQYRQSKSYLTLDLKNQTMMDIAKDSEYRKYLYIYTAKAVNDTVLFIEDMNPISLKREDDMPELGIVAHERKYIFHGNGDIEINMGNMVSEIDDHNDGTFMVDYVDGNTGLITFYWKNDAGERNIYRVTSDGELAIGKDYGWDALTDKKVATASFNQLKEDLAAIQEKMAIASK